MDDFLALLIKVVVYGVILFVLPLIVSKTFLDKTVDKRALGMVIAVLFGLAIVSIANDLVNLLTQPILDHNTTVTLPQQQFNTQFRNGGTPLNLNIR